MPTLTVQQAFDLALQHQRAGRLAEAEALYRQVIGVQRDHVDALNNLGIVLGCQGRMEDAASLFREVVALRPAHADAWNNLGITVATQGRFAEAVEAYNRSLALVPDQSQAHNNLGNAYKELGDLEQAEAEYRRALQQGPGDADILRNLGNIFRVRGRFDDAIAAYRRVLSVAPGNAEAYSELCIAQAAAERLDEALAAGQRAVELAPESSNAHINLGNIFKDRGEVSQAIAAFRRAVAVEPGNIAAHDNLIYTLEFDPGVDESTILAARTGWQRQVGESPKERWRQPSADRNPQRRLRVGYVSADFRDHVVGRNLMPLFGQHDCEGFEIFCYSGVVRPDGMTQQFRDKADHWCSTLGMNDEALADRIVRDGVDILVDLTQHMAGNRLTMFARSPAPVRVSFAGYPETAGVEAIEYRISDRFLEPTSREGVFLIDSFWCYDPCGMEVEVNASPAQGNGWVTFGCLNNFCKVTEATLRLWAQVLVKAGDSKLMILSPNGSHRQRTLQILEREGVAPQRIEFVEPRGRRAYLQLYHGLDVMLDTSPYNGHTTSLDALWMGVPVVSLAGERAVSRAGLSQLTNLGLPELIARSEDAYVAIATGLAGDLSRLGELRRTLRARMEASVLMDGRRFAKGIEEAYRKMWRHCCQG